MFCLTNKQSGEERKVQKADQYSKSNNYRSHSSVSPFIARRDNFTESWDVQWSSVRGERFFTLFGSRYRRFFVLFLFFGLENSIGDVLSW